MSVLWNKYLSVGIPEMDEQHRGLFAMIAEHACFLEKIQLENTRADINRCEAAAALHHYLCHWLSNHIVCEDKKYGHFIVEKNERSA